MNDNKDPLNNAISTEVKGLNFFKDGVRMELPPGTSYNTLIQALQRQAREEDQVVNIREQVDAFMLEGAVAFHQALKEVFGWVQKGDVQDDVPAFLTMMFGAPPASPVKMLSVQTGLDTTEQVVWDQVKMPGVDGFLQPDFVHDNGRFFFLITGEVKQKHKARVMEVVAATKRIVRERSIYKGKALEVDLPVPERGMDITKHAPRFMKGLDAIDPRGMIFSKKLEAELETYVFNVIRKTKLLARLGISAHRGALFMGPPGTGKTLAAAVTAKIAQDHGWTYFYVKNPDQIVPMYKLAASYGPAVLFVEDVDQAVLKGGDDEDVSDHAKKKFRELLNALDGVDTKGSQVFVIFTTNKDPRNFDPAFTREARLDSIINFTPPDEEAVGRLIRWYLGRQLDANASLDKVSKELAGLRPASIKEVCAKSILGAVARLPDDTDPDNLPDGIINEDDLMVAALVIKEQIELAKPLPSENVPDSDEERAAVFLGDRIERGLATSFEHLGNLLKGQLGNNEHPKHGTSNGARKNAEIALEG